MFPSTLEEAILSDERVFERFEYNTGKGGSTRAPEGEADEGNW